MDAQSAGWWFFAVCLALLAIATVAALELYGNNMALRRTRDSERTRANRNHHERLLAEQRNRDLLRQIDSLNEELQTGRVNSGETMG